MVLTKYSVKLLEESMQFSNHQLVRFADPHHASILSYLGKWYCKPCFLTDGAKSQLTLAGMLSICLRVPASAAGSSMAMYYVSMQLPSFRAITTMRAVSITLYAILWHIT